MVEGIQTSGDVGTELNPRELPGSVVVRTLHLHCRGPEFKPWSRNLDPTSPVTLPKKKKMFKRTKSSSIQYTEWDFPGGPVVKNPLCNAEGVG